MGTWAHTYRTKSPARRLLQEYWHIKPGQQVYQPPFELNFGVGILWSTKASEGEGRGFVMRAAAQKGSHALHRVYVLPLAPQDGHACMHCMSTRLCIFTPHRALTSPCLWLLALFRALIGTAGGLQHLVSRMLVAQ